MRGANIPIAYQGVIYPSLNSACEAAGINRGAVYTISTRSQISKQEAFDQAVVEGVKTGKTPIVYKGVTYPTIASACEAAGINVNTVYTRSHELQISHREAFDQLVSEGLKRANIPIMYQGVTYSSVPAACEAASINPATVHTRSTRLQISKQEAFDQVVEEGLRQHQIPIVYQDVTYPSLTAACEVAGITRSAVRSRSSVLQISTQEAFDQLIADGVRKSRVPIVYQGVTYSSVSAACEAAGINPSTVLGRNRRLQVSKQEAFDLVVEEGFRKLPRIPIVYQGVTYPSLTAACEVASISHATVRHRSRRLQISAQEAFDIILSKKNDPVYMCRSIGASSNDLIEVKHAYVSRSGTTYLTCTYKTCNRRILLPYETAKNYRHAEEFCVDHEYKGRH